MLLDGPDAADILLHRRTSCVNNPRLVKRLVKPWGQASGAGTRSLPPRRTRMRGITNCVCLPLRRGLRIGCRGPRVPRAIAAARGSSRGILRVEWIKTVEQAPALGGKWTKAFYRKLGRQELGFFREKLPTNGRRKGNNRTDEELGKVVSFFFKNERIRQPGS